MTAASDADDRSGLADVRARLEAARRRGLRASLAGVLAWSLALALLVLVAMEGVRALAPAAFRQGFGWLPSDPPWAAAAVMAAAALLLAALALVLPAGFRRPELLTTARAAERRFLLQGRVSAALESERPGVAPPVVVRALFADAASRAAAIDPRQLVPFRVPRIAWAIPVLVALAVLVELAPPAPITAAPGPAAAPAEFLSAEEQAAVARLLRESAAGLATARPDPEADPMAAALSRTLANLAETIAAAPAVDRSALAGQIGDLARQADRVFQGGPPIAGTPPPAGLEALQAALHAVNTGRFESTAGNPQMDIVPAGEEGGDAPEGASAPAGAPADAAAPGELAGDIASPDQPADAAGGIGAPAGAQPPADAPYDYFEAAQLLLEQQDSDISGDMAGQLAGAAENAGRGESRLAGRGTQPLGDETPWDRTAVALGEELVLGDADPADEGRRLRLELPPETRPATIAADAVPPDAAGHRATSEAAVRHAVVGPDRRETVRRYFLPADPAASP